MRYVAPVFALLLSFVPAIVRAESAVEFLSLRAWKLGAATSMA